MNNVQIADIMTREPITAAPNSSLLECAKKMVSKKISSLIIIENKKIKGIISQRDILWAMIKKPKKDLKSIQAKEISAKKILTIKPSSSVREAINKMKKLKAERLPVTLDGRLVGILSIKDILNFNPEFYPELEEIKGIKEQESKLKRLRKAFKKKPKQGICEKCGNNDFLKNFNGMMVCESCENCL